MKPLNAALAILVAATLAVGAAGSAHAWKIEGAPAIKLQQTRGESLKKGVAFKTRFSTFGQKSLWSLFGLQAMIDWEYHPTRPTAILGGAIHVGKNFFFEPGAGIYFGQLLGQGWSIAIPVVFGYEVTQKLFISIPFVYRMDRGIWEITYMPYIGFQF
ncbi:MAG: hypothetical protein A2583_07960 [Bdellovibrionales bacterium RIFOXYD1_FULL_53_11]|nr:MAG: hypothetical protein A2583_07960 [Bdellovibrionales bacterium RIFOXYD1_FULL_53_11]